MDLPLPSINSDDVTLDAPIEVLVPRDSSTGGSHGNRPQVSLVETSDIEPGRESAGFLRRRLAWASLALGIGFSIFSAWMIMRIAFGLEQKLWWLQAHQLFVTGVLLGTGWTLLRSTSCRARDLLISEIAIFGLPATLFMVFDYNQAVTCASQFGMLPQFTMSGWLLLMFTRAIFIPSSWQKAAGFTIGIATLPIVVAMVALATQPLVSSIAMQDPSPLVEMVLQLAAAACVAILGVRTINHLRSEATQGRQLGRYRLREKLGSGGMGEVYLAEHVLMKRHCAIKVIRPEKAGDPRMLARFEREVKATARLSHWNSVHIFDYGRTADGTFYYVMEYLPGASVDQVIKRFGPMRPERTLFLLRQVCDALWEAHQNNLIHRDIKPANIFVAERGGLFDVAKLLDFGMVKPILSDESVELTQDGTLAGSPLFMAPEQATGSSDPDARTDIYALGVVAFFMLTGRTPFTSRQPLQVLMSHVGEPPPRPSSVLPQETPWTIPGDFEELILKCLEKRPEDRYGDVRELAAALEACESFGEWTFLDAERWWKTHCVHHKCCGEVSDSAIQADLQPQVA